MRHKPSMPPGLQGRPATALSSAPLRVEIGRLTIEGYTRLQQRLFTESFHQSLRTMMASLDSTQASVNRAIRRLDIGSLQMGTSAKEAGDEVARRIVSSIFKSSGRKI
ncbi:hypothetical protein [Silvibacterium acidisoli]|uniref:hypothetical protein n=1 Tax=Acidobacteriaceae bacterium ZG23-2 TaxID=2883246 RepID=UPI00406C29B3